MIFRPGEPTNVPASVTSNSIGGEESREISYVEIYKSLFLETTRSVEIVPLCGRLYPTVTEKRARNDDRARGNDNGAPNSSRRSILVDNKESGDEYGMEGGGGRGG